MAENVNIVGFPGSVLKEALKEVPAWATEKTAQQIEVILSRSLKVQEQTAKNLINAVKDGIAKGTDVNLDPLHDYLDELEDVNRQLKDNKEQEEKRQKDLDKQVKEDGERRDRATDALIAGLTKFSSVVRATLSTNIDSFSQLDQAGVALTSGFGNIDSGFKAISNISKNTGVRITELSGLLSQYSTAINVAGMAKFTKTVGESSKTLNQFGYTNKQAAELLGAYLETERLRGETGARSQLSTQRQLEKFGKSVRDLGLASGMARDEILANLKAQSASTDSFINSIKLGADAGKNIDLFIASLKDQELARKISGLMTTDFKTLNQTYMDLVKTGNGALASSLANVTESMKGLEPEEQKRILMEWAAANETALDQAALQAKRMQDAGVEGGAESLATIRQLKTELKSYRELSDEERAAQQKSAEAASALSSEYEKLKAQLTILITPVTALIQALTFAVSVINTVIDTVSGVINSVFGENTTSYILQAVGALGGLVAAGLALSKVFTLVTGAMSLFRGGLVKGIVGRITGTAAGAAGSVAGGVAGTVAKGAAESAASGVAGSLASGAAESLAGGAAPAKGGGIGKILSSVGSGVGNIVASLGKGAGKLIEAVMTGVSRGMAAFANPLVLKGALILAGALAIISGGIRLSAFILGDSLSKIAEGFTAFNKLDGGNLIKVGAGIAALGAGLVAFTVGNALSNIGSILNGVTEGFMSLLGIDGPMDKLQAFADLGPGLEMAGNGLNMITESISLLSGAMTEIPESNKIKDIVDQINGLSLIKVAALGALLSFGSMPAYSDTATPGTEFITKNAPLIKSKTISETAVSTEPASIKPPPGSTIKPQEKIVKEKTESEKEVEKQKQQEAVSTAQRTETVDINSMINQQNITLSRLLENAENQLSVNKEMLQYIRAQ